MADACQKEAGGGGVSNSHFSEKMLRDSSKDSHMTLSRLSIIDMGTDSLFFACYSCSENPVVFSSCLSEGAVMRTSTEFVYTPSLYAALPLTNSLLH